MYQLALNFSNLTANELSKVYVLKSSETEYITPVYFDKDGNEIHPNLSQQQYKELPKREKHYILIDLSAVLPIRTQEEKMKAKIKIPIQDGDKEVFTEYIKQPLYMYRTKASRYVESKIIWSTEQMEHELEFTLLPK